MTHFYEELQKARQARNLSLKEVSVATKISQVMLEALEQGKVRQLPEAYIRAFIREYARFLRLDEAEILQEYDTEFRGNHHHNNPHPVPAVEEPMTRDAWITRHETTAPAPEPASRTLKPMRPPRTKRTDTNMTAIIASAIVVVTGLVFAYFFLSSGSSEKKPAPTANQPPPPIVPQYTPPTAQTQTNANATQTTQPSATTAYPKDSLTLEAATTDSVWVSVVADTAHVQRGVLPKGAKKMWRAKNRFFMTVGNSKLVSFALNGKPLPYADAVTHVVRNVIVTANTTSLASTEAAPAEQQAKGAAVADRKTVPLKKRPPMKRKVKGPIPAIQKVPVQ